MPAPQFIGGGDCGEVSMGDKIEIVPYQMRWQDEFAEIVTDLWTVWGDDAVRIDHIGSTAVVVR